MSRSTIRAQGAPLEWIDDTTGPRGPGSSIRGTEAGWALAAMAVALAFAVLVLRVWRGDFAVPWSWGYDQTTNLMVIKAIISHGWYQHIPELGAPYGLTLYDFPAYTGDTLSLLAFRGLALFTSNPATIANVYFLAGFPLVALSAFVVLRRFGLGRPVALVIAVVFAFLPYHFLRGEQHIFLGAYVSVPLGCYLILRNLGQPPLFARRLEPDETPPKSRAIGRRWWRGWLTRRNWVLVLCCVVVGCLGTDYALFTVTLLVVTGGIAAIGRRKLTPLVCAAVTSVLILGTLGAEAMPVFIYRAGHGANPVVAHRFPIESGRYALSIPAMLSPLPQNRFAPLAAAGRNFAGDEDALSYTLEERFVTIGLLAGAGFCLVLVIGLARVTGRSPGGDSLLDRVALVTLTAVLAGVSGGFALIFAALVTPDLRAWARIAVIVAFLALLAWGVLLERARLRLQPGRRGAVGFAAGLVALLLLAVAEQTNDSFIPPYALNAARQQNVANLVSAIERRVPAGSEIWQLPYSPFPEFAPRAGETMYDQLIPYLYSSRLRWSGGAMRGRSTDWQAELGALPVARMLPGVAASGFRGVLVDRLAYADGGTGDISQLTRLVGPAAITSRDGRYAFFDLGPYTASLRARIAPSRLDGLAAATVAPLSLQFGTGFYAREQFPSGPGYWAQERAELDVANPAGRPALALIRGTLRTGVPQPGPISITLPGSQRTLWIPAEGRPWSVRLVLPPGTTRITFVAHVARTPAPTDPRILYFRIDDPSVVRPQLGIP